MAGAPIAIKVASGAVMTQAEILQRIRELSVQAANEIHTQSNLEGIQAEIDQQIAELGRIGNTFEFNGKKE